MRIGNVDLLNRFVLAPLAGINCTAFRMLCKENGAGLMFQLPWGEKAAFKGVIDLVTMRAYANEGKTAEEIPADLKPAAEEARTALMEAAADGDDALMEKYFADGKLNDEELAKGLKAIVRSGSYIPVFVTAGSHEKGVLPLLDAVIKLMLSPAEAPAAVAASKAGEETLAASDTGPVALYVWKTTADPFVGKMTYFKVVSGSVTADIHFWNQNKGADERMVVCTSSAARKPSPSRAYMRATLPSSPS